MEKDIIMYNRSTGCAYSTLAKRVFKKHGLDWKEIYFDEDPEAEQRVREWTGYLPAPTIVLAKPGDVVPFEPPAKLPPGKSPRGLDRGSMISEASVRQLTRWLENNNMIASAS